MIRYYPIKRSFLFLPMLFVSIFSSDAQNLYDEAHTYQFARYLMGSRQYELAISEYERLVYFNPVNTDYQVGLIKGLRLNNQADLVRTKLDYFYPEGLCQLIPELAKEYAHSQYLSGSEPGDFLSCATELTDIQRNSFRAANLLKEGSITEAKNYVNEHPEVELGLASIAQRKVKRVSPFFATVCSVLIPGSGKFVAHRWKDGLFSFVLISGFAYQSFRGFEKRGVQSVYGWIFGALGSAYYLGTVYGTYGAAREYNETQLAIITRDVTQVLDHMD